MFERKPCSGIVLSFELKKETRISKLRISKLNLKIIFWDLRNTYYADNKKSDKNIA